MMATEIIEIDAPLAEKWTKTRVSFLSAPTVGSSLLTSGPHTIVCILISISVSFSDCRGTVGLDKASKAGSPLILPQRTNNKTN